jgi:hypothetical protein
MNSTTGIANAVLGEGEARGERGGAGEECMGRHKIGHIISKNLGFCIGRSAIEEIFHLRVPVRRRMTGPEICLGSRTTDSYRHIPSHRSSRMSNIDLKCGDFKLWHDDLEQPQRDNPKIPLPLEMFQVPASELGAVYQQHMPKEALEAPLRTSFQGMPSVGSGSSLTRYSDVFAEALYIESRETILVTDFIVPSDIGRDDSNAQHYSHSGRQDNPRPIKTKRLRKGAKCDVCGASFIRFDHCQRHMVGHTREKSHKCNVCNRLFSRKDALIRHSRLH